MVTIEQCRAARGLLGWTQQDLADACGMSKTAINNFEKGHSDIKADSLRAIRRAFEGANIEFIGDDGLRMKNEDVKILRGGNVSTLLMHEIISTLENADDRSLMVLCPSDTAFSDLSPNKINQYESFMLSQGVDVRIIQPTATNKILQRADYRTFDESGNYTDISPMMTSYLYGGYIAIELWGKSMIVLIRSEDVYKTEKTRFEMLWERLEMNKKSEAISEK